ncbi:sensor histidine kinase [Luteibacter rhizovicinus]|uniref:sensor histidine kinase n=1 Tax=Luteibacter rhizovicinus TaxID=242606 RepID=UPI0014052CBF|nr:sensor histidine kinase [Luteibacter rhizovicinus]
MVAWLIATACAWADAPDSREEGIGQFYHTAWTVREGAPGQITALAQSSDGYLWLGTQTGLYRFDGVSFERFRPRADRDFPASSVSALHATPEGLWVGFRYGFASLVTRDRTIHFDARDGLPTSTIFAFAQTRDGTVWAATFRGLARYRGHRWEMIGPEWKLPGSQARTVYVDPGGTLWVATDTTLACLPPGETSFRVASDKVARVNRILQDPAGAIWVAETDGAVRPVFAATGDAAANGPELKIPAADLLFDADGALWVPTMGDGIRRVPKVRAMAGKHIDSESADAEPFVERDGLTSDYVSAVLQDREGNIWFGSSRGLDRFRQSKLLPAEFPAGSFDFALAAGDNGGIWAGTKNRALMKLDGQTVTFEDLRVPVSAAYRDPDGVVWLGGPDGIWRIVKGKLSRFADLPSEGGYSGVQAIVRDNAGALWVSINRPGIYRLADGQWTHVETFPEFPKGSSPLSLMTDRAGRVWMGFARNQITRRNGDKVIVITATEGLDTGNVTALHEDGQTVWVGGERGLGYAVGDRIAMIQSLGEPLRGISGIVHDSHGDLWLNAASGIARISANDIARAQHEPDYRVRTDIFDSLDGMPGTPAQFRPIPSAIAGTDGRLWFATTSGVVSIDPAHVRHNATPPPVDIVSVSTEAGTWEIAGPVNLPAHTQRLRIGYTAASLTMPERVRFRYRLDGLDDRWRDAGTDREAVYTNPGPGRYTFHVLARNEDGVWNEQGATLDIRIAPAFYQTVWFALLCVVLALLVLRVIFLLRMRQMESQLRARLHERHAERERIARELHDTLLQSIQGLTMRFQAIANRVPAGTPLRTEMESALDRADEALVEARDRVKDLRTYVVDLSDLGGALEDVARDLGHDHPMAMRCTIGLDTEIMDPIVRDEIYQIAREAMQNAYSHAHADHLDIDIEAIDNFVLSIRDDGCGIDPAFLTAGGKPGHWGLRGMRERAERIGASMTIDSIPGSGTRIVLHLPLIEACPRTATRSARWWRRVRQMLVGMP